MRRGHINHKRNPAPLRVLSVNVQNTGPNNDAILSLASEGEYDVVHVQEPYAVWGLGRQMIKSHPTYKTYMPTEAWKDRDSRPRVLTYVRKTLQADQLPVTTTRYVIWIHVQGVTLVNVYRKPRDTTTLGSTPRVDPQGEVRRYRRL